MNALPNGCANAATPAPARTSSHGFPIYSGQCIYDKSATLATAPSALRSINTRRASAIRTAMSKSAGAGDKSINGFTGCEKCEKGTYVAWYSLLFGSQCLVLGDESFYDCRLAQRRNITKLVVFIRCHFAKNAPHNFS